MGSSVKAPRRFCLVLIKPSHYDDDGYVIQWVLSSIPSNTLAALYGLAKDCAERRVLGDDVSIELHALDETNTYINPKRIARLVRAAGAGMAMLVGVQSNQLPRALDIARPLLAEGIPVAMGGFHISGTISMLGGAEPYMDRARQMGISLFAGEAEDGRLDEVLRDAHAGTLKPLYNHMKDLPSIAGAPIPLLMAERAQRTAGGVTSFDAGRGCPYQCSFCTIINVQGRVSRRRTPEDIEQIVRVNYRQGLRAFFITDDNFARNKDWEAIIDRIIFLRETEKFDISFIIQVDTLCHRIPHFIEKCARAGVKRVFIGLENINPDNLAGAKKKQNRITEYREMLLAWKRAKVITYAGYILGFPHDSFESIMRDIDVIKRELPIDLLEFFYLTPLPGSEDHLTLLGQGVVMDADLNKYDLNHVTAPHPTMSRQEWDRAYQAAWERYYTVEHIETVLKRAAAMGANASNALFLITWFTGSVRIEKVHPLESGFLRRKMRRQRRPELPREWMVPFYARYWSETLVKLVRWTALYVGLRRRYLRIKHDPNKAAYRDIALTAPDAEGAAAGELLASEAAKAYVAQEKRLRAAGFGAKAGA